MNTTEPLRLSMGLAAENLRLVDDLRSRLGDDPAA